MPVSLPALVTMRGARRAILLKAEIISATVAGCSEATILVMTRGSLLVVRNAATIEADASSAEI
jgi:hypothetical protein